MPLQRRRFVLGDEPMGPPAKGRPTRLSGQQSEQEPSGLAVFPSEAADANSPS